jgi:hypothetical protein
MKLVWKEISAISEDYGPPYQIAESDFYLFSSKFRCTLSDMNSKGWMLVEKVHWSTNWFDKFRADDLNTVFSKVKALKHLDVYQLESEYNGASWIETFQAACSLHSSTLTSLKLELFDSLYEGDMLL